MKRFVFTISFFWAGVFVSCQKDALKPVDNVCSVMDDDAFKEYCLKSFDSAVTAFFRWKRRPRLS